MILYFNGTRLRIAQKAGNTLISGVSVFWEHRSGAIGALRSYSPILVGAIRTSEDSSKVHRWGKDKYFPLELGHMSSPTLGWQCS